MDASSSPSSLDAAATTVVAAAAAAQCCYGEDSDRGKNHDDEIIFLHDKNGGLLDERWTPNYIGGRIYY